MIYLHDRLFWIPILNKKCMILPDIEILNVRIINDSKKLIGQSFYSIYDFILLSGIK